MSLRYVGGWPFLVKGKSGVSECAARSFVILCVSLMDVPARDSEGSNANVARQK